MTPLDFCKKFRINNYIINSDGTIDVSGDVKLNGVLKDMTKLPVKFGKVYGDFQCAANNLTILDGCPNYVGVWFCCRDNNLTSLEGCPKYVHKFYSDVITHHILGNVKSNIRCYEKNRIVI
jgi:hypothetical protein